VHQDDVQIRDEVEFVVRTDRKSGRFVATKVRGFLLGVL
jgi:hypothetical protein